MTKELTVFLTLAGDPETGKWCASCALPSAVDFELKGLGEGALMHVLDMGRARVCTDCGEASRVVDE